jgi:hypothetical protein
MPVERVWVYKKGFSKKNPKQGYSVSRSGKYWVAELWLGNKIIRRDNRDTKELAINYCRQRKREHFGGR